MSKNIVKKHVDGFPKKGLITTEYTTVTTKDGRVHNGSLLYTLLPIEAVEEAYLVSKINPWFYQGSEKRAERTIKSAS